MKQLYQVTTKTYKTYYVFANGYDDAKCKTEDYMVNEESKAGIVSEDGSLNLNYEMSEIREIRLISENVIR
jgi:hypothetical protein